MNLCSCIAISSCWTAVGLCGLGNYEYTCFVAFWGLIATFIISIGVNLG